VPGKLFHYKELLFRTGGNQTRAAEIAGLIRRTFNNRLKTVEEKLKDKGKNFADIPKLTDLLRQLI
jgi:hypothetical protein